MVSVRAWSIPRQGRPEQPGTLRLPADGTPQQARAGKSAPTTPSSRRSSRRTAFPWVPSASWAASCSPRARPVVMNTGDFEMTPSRPWTPPGAVDGRHERFRGARFSPAKPRALARRGHARKCERSPILSAGRDHLADAQEPWRADGVADRRLRGGLVGPEAETLSTEEHSNEGPGLHQQKPGPSLSLRTTRVCHPGLGCHPERRGISLPFVIPNGEAGREASPEREEISS